MHIRTLLPYAAGLATALALSGCAAEEQTPAAATPLTTSTSAAPTASSPSPTTTVDPVIARIPKAARENTQEGAEAFAKFYYEQVADSWEKGDPSLLDGLHTKDCKTCLAFRETADYLMKHGQRFIGSPPPLVIEGASAISFQTSGPVIAVQVTEHAGRVIDQAGDTVRSVPGTGKQTFVATLRLTDGNWNVVRSQVEVIK